METWSEAAVGCFTSMSYGDYKNRLDIPPVAPGPPERFTHQICSLKPIALRRWLYRFEGKFKVLTLTWLVGLRSVELITHLEISPVIFLF